MGKILGVWLVLELILAWMVIHWLGFGVLLLSWLAAMVTGMYLLRGLGEHVQQLRQGGASLSFGGPLARVGAALLLIIPGTLSDILALLILFPRTQTHISRRFSGSFTTWKSSVEPAGRIFEGEFAEETHNKPLIEPKK